MTDRYFRTQLTHKFHPAQLIVFSFLALIVTGTCLLMLPISNLMYDCAWINHLFVCVTSVCVTGLVPVVICEQYSLFGQIVILCLIQLGGLGLMIWIVFVMSLSHHKLKVKEKGILLDAMNMTSRKDVLKYLRHIVLFTLISEGCGAFLLSIRFIPEYGFFKGVFHSLFLSVSAFCNAGLDLLGSDSLIPFQHDLLVNLIVIALIVTGGLGFVIWYEIKTQRKWSVYTRLVLVCTGCLLVAGTISFFVLEHNNPDTMQDSSFFHQVLISLFQSAALRTAGFSTVKIAQCTPATKYVMLFFMLVGGSSTGTAGGLKTSTFVLLIAFLISEIQGKTQVIFFKRAVSAEVLKKAIVLILCTNLILAISIFMLMMSEHQDLLTIAFEAFSALSTTGLSCGLTPSLSDFGKWVIITLMFAGRVGPVQLLLIFLDRNRQSRVHVAETEILTG